MDRQKSKVPVKTVKINKESLKNAEDEKIGKIVEALKEADQPRSEFVHLMGYI